MPVKKNSQNWEAIQSFWPKLIPKMVTLKSFTSDDSFSYSIWKNMWGIRILQKEALVLVWLRSINNLIKLINESYKSLPSKEPMLFKMHKVIRMIRRISIAYDNSPHTITCLTIILIIYTIVKPYNYPAMFVIRQTFETTENILRFFGVLQVISRSKKRIRV